MFNIFKTNKKLSPKRMSEEEYNRFISLLGETVAKNPKILYPKKENKK